MTKKNNEYVGVDDKFIPEEEYSRFRDSAYQDMEQMNQSYENHKQTIEKHFNSTMKMANNIRKFAILIFVFAFCMIGFNIFMAVSSFSKFNDKKNDIEDMINDNVSDFTDVQDDIAKKSFNSIFELYSGTSATIHVEALLDKVITNNKTNPDHVIIVRYREYLTKEPEIIADIKHELEDFSEYEVKLDYDDGYVYRIRIEDIE